MGMKEFQKMLRKHFGEYLSKEEVELFFQNLFTDFLGKSSVEEFLEFKRNGLTLDIFEETVLNYNKYAPPPSLFRSFWLLQPSHRCDKIFQWIWPIVLSAVSVAAVLMKNNPRY